jgi:hypothetical protein
MRSSGHVFQAITASYSRVCGDARCQLLFGRVDVDNRASRAGRRVPRGRWRCGLPRCPRRGTTSDDLASFARRFNEIRVGACLAPIPPANFRFDQCLQDRLFWVAEDPSGSPGSAWGHRPQRSDGAPVVGCDGNLAGGNNYSGATVADRWWQSASHQQSLSRPAATANPATVCIGFAMTHGGVPNEPVSFVRASAVRTTC